MIKIKANIYLYEGKNKRQTPFYSGYRPIFQFDKNTQTSGAFKIIDKEKINPGEEAIVWIYFLNKEHLTNKKSKYILEFTFSEASETLGKGHVLQVYECNEIDLAI